MSEHRELIAKDIVDQLRLHKPQFTAGVCSRAIQEITRLRAENAELRELCERRYHELDKHRCQCRFVDGKQVEECHFHACERHVGLENGDPSDITFDEYERLQKARDAMRTLERLTPGGSEYVNDPKQCESFIRRTRTMQHETILRFKRERDEARRDLAALRAKLETASKDLLASAEPFDRACMVIREACERLQQEGGEHDGE